MAKSHSILIVALAVFVLFALGCIGNQAAPAANNSTSLNPTFRNNTGNQPQKQPTNLTNATSNLTKQNSSSLGNGFTLVNSSSNSTIPTNESNASMQNASNATVIVRPFNPHVTPKVVAYYFYEAICPYSYDVNQFLPSFKAKYNESDFQLATFEIWYNATKNFPLYLKFIKAYNVSDDLHVVPMIFINNTYIYTNGTIKDSLGEMVDACLASGSCIDPYDKVLNSSS